MDITQGVVDAPITIGGATETETSDVSTDTGSVAPENKGQAGGSQDTAEGGQEEVRDSRERRGPTKLDTIRELRGRLREQRSFWESEVGTLKSQLEDIQKSIAFNRNQGTKPSKTFWEAPEEVLDDRVKSHLSEFEKRMMSALQQRQSMDQEGAEWKQETSQAAEFIRSQKGITRNDEEDIAEIIRETPAMANIRPSERAEYALFLWQKERGITDKSEMKARATSVTGAPPSAGGKRSWTDSDIQRELDKFPKDPKNWTPEMHKAFDVLDNEIREAAVDGRMK